MKGKVGKAAVVVLGAGAAAVGFAMQLTMASYGSFLWVLSAVLIGLGCGAFGHGLGDLLSQRALKDAPELARRLEIEATDERNVALANAAKAKAFDQMILSFLRRSNAGDLAHILDMPHGFAGRLIAMASKAGTVDELVELCCVKHYTRARIRRLLFASFLGIPHLGYDKAPAYVRVLGMNQTGQTLLSRMRESCRLPVITKAANYPEKDTDLLFRLDCKSTDLYNLAFPAPEARKAGADFTTSPIIL